jgi:hypothetical protein
MKQKYRYNLSLRKILPIEIALRLRIVKIFYIPIDKQNRKHLKTILNKINRIEKLLRHLKRAQPSKVRLILKNKIKMI